MHSKHLMSGVVLCAAALTQVGNAAAIDAVVSNVGGDRWEFAYTLNNTLPFPIEEFSVFFDLGLFADLEVMTSPAGWDSIAIQPDALLPDDGFFDALALDSGVATGGSMSGFVVRARYLAGGAPGAQLFHVVDPLSFDTLFVGTTRVVPLPPALLLFAGAVGLTGALRRKGARA